MIEDISKYIIKDDTSILDALYLLDKLPSDALTLFVVNSDNVLLGTMTDGDVRRALISGYVLEDVVSKMMKVSYRYISDEANSLVQIQQFRKERITLIPLLDKDKKIISIYNLNRKRSLLPIDAVLMAGGRGERLRPLTEKTPKPLLKVGSKSIIDYNVESLISFGLEYINVTVNYLHEQIEKHFEEKINGVSVSCVKEPKFLGTIGSIKLVETFHNDTILVMNSDLFTNINYEDFYLHFKLHDADISVAAVPYGVSVPYGIFELDGRDIKGVKEKPTYNYYANAGIYLIKKEILNLIPNDTFFNATDFIELLIANNKKVVRFPVTGYWIDIGQHTDYEKAKEIVKHL